MKILIVKLSAIGDVVHTLPALNAIRQHYPDAHITWLVEEDAAGLVQGHTALDRVLISRRKRWLKELFGPKSLDRIREACLLAKELRETHYDLVIDFQGLLKSSALITLSRGNRKIGFGKGMEHAEGSYLFLNERVPAVDMDIHALKRNLMLLEAIGIPSKDVAYDLPIQPQNRKAVDRLLRQHGIQNAELLVAINPVAKWETKLWSNVKFAELADRLIAHNHAHVVFTGSLDDRRRIHEIISIMEKTACNLAGRTDLMSLAALYERTGVVITTDTGPMHIAAAVGTPVVALFGPTAPWRTGPFGPAHQVIRVSLECSPCFKRNCGDIQCMEQISVERVLEGVKQLGVVYV